MRRFIIIIGLVCGCTKNASTAQLSAGAEAVESASPSGNGRSVISEVLNNQMLTTSAPIEVTVDFDGETAADRLSRFRLRSEGIGIASGRLTADQIQAIANEPGVQRIDLPKTASTHPMYRATGHGTR